jgi:cytochrome c
LTDTGLFSFSRIWKILLDGKLGHWMVWERNVTNQLSKSNVHLTKSLNQSSIAQFQLYGNYPEHRKIAILNREYKHIIKNHYNLNA